MNQIINSVLLFVMLGIIVAAILYSLISENSWQFKLGTTLLLVLLYNIIVIGLIIREEKQLLRQTSKPSE